MSIPKLAMLDKNSFKYNSKSLFILAFPLFIEILLNNLLGTIDTIMIGNYDPSGNLVAAISDCNTILTFLVVLFTISSVGVGIVVSQYLGAKKEDTSKVLSQGIILNLGLSIIITLIFIFTSKYILIATKVPENIFEATNGYLFIVSFSLPFQAITCCLSANLKSYSKPYYVTIIYLISNGINAILNYILIFGKLGIEPLGYKGAAISTLICHILVCIASIIITKIKLKQTIFSFKIDKKILSNILKIGLPSALESICYNISQIIVLAQVNKLMENAIAARSYVNLFQTYIYMFSSAIGSANAILVGYSIGEKNYQNAKNTTGLSTLYSYPIIIFLVSLLNILGFLIFPLLNKNQAILDNIYSILPLVFLVELGRNANLIYINALKSAGDTLFPVIMAIIFMFLVSALGSYIFGIVLNLKLVGIFLAVGLDELFRAIFCYIRWKKGKWTNFNVK